LAPLVLVPVNEIIAAPIEVAMYSKLTVTAAVPAPLVAIARQAWIRRVVPLKTSPPAVPISEKVNPAPLMLVTMGAMPLAQPSPVEQELAVKAM
jgi:hypothetical protein